MAEIHGKAGEWTRVKGTVLGLWPLFIGIFFCGFSAALAVAGHPALGGILGVLSLVGCVLSYLIGLRRVERFFKGARGEERVSGILQSLPSRYHVFNDFVAGGLHVDHVVVGPAGVFAVETKNWRGKITIEDDQILVDGQLPSRPPLTQLLRETARVKTALAKAGWNGGVTPILVFASDTFGAHIAELRGAVVINSCELRKGFETDRVIIPPAELERLVRLMENCQ